MISLNEETSEQISKSWLPKRTLWVTTSHFGQFDNILDFFKVVISENITYSWDRSADMTLQTEFYVTCVFNYSARVVVLFPRPKNYFTKKFSCNFFLSSDCSFKEDFPRIFHTLWKPPVWNFQWEASDMANHHD